MWTYEYTPYPDELYHYGVLGMKWGIRKERQSSGTGRGRGRGRKKLTDKQKKIIRNVAIGAGAAALAGGAVAGGIWLHKRGLPGLRRYKQNLYATKGLSEGQIRLQRQRSLESGDKMGVKATTKALKNLKRSTLREQRAAGRRLAKQANYAMNDANIPSSTLRSTIANQNSKPRYVKAAKKELSRRGASKGFNQVNQYMPWNKRYKANVSNPNNSWIRTRQNVNINKYNKAVTRGNIARTAAVIGGAGVAGAAGAGGAYIYNKNKRKRK